MARSNWKYVDHLKDYCSNCTLAGFSYIANQNLHFIERIFWLICVVLSAAGSLILISQYQRDFNSRAVSIVYESLPSTHKVSFPTIAVCDMYNKFIASDDLINFVTDLDTRDKKDYSDHVEMFINFLVYPYFYREDNIKGWCSQECDDGCAKCPAKDLRQLYRRVSVLNEEDIPHNSLPGYKVEANKAGQVKTFQIFMQSTSNDPDVREITPEFRQCRFPDELLDDTAYKAYSFSTCFFDCLRIFQMQECNCSAYNFMPEQNTQNSDCDLKGFLCLEKFTLVRPDARNLLPWADSKYSCECLPSCTENEFKVVYDHQTPPNKSNPHMTITVTVPEFATERYRRQAIRTRLDVVVTIGGIMGLFLGASILSGIEFIYYFTLRLCNNYRMARSQRK